MIETKIDPEAETSTTTLTAYDRKIVDAVDRALSDGLDLKRWWDNVDAEDAYEDRFELSRTHNRPDMSFGFFGEATVAGCPMPVMGNVQEMFYDRPKTPRTDGAAAAPAKSADQLTLANYPQWLCDQLREFVLHYFMRTSDFRQPEAYPDLDEPEPPDFLKPLSWRPTGSKFRTGFGYSQQYYKRKDTGEAGKFSEDDSSAIIDLRELSESYDWIVLKVRIFDFKFCVAPMGPDAPHIVIPASEESYLVISGDFILNETEATADELGRFGLGYVFLKADDEGVLAYGPGHFDAAFQVINFHVSKSGEIRSRMAFVANRPKKVVNISLDPVNWTLSLADTMSMGVTSNFTKPVKEAWKRVPMPGGVDVVSAYASLANLVTGGMAESELSISKGQLERNFLLQHFTQHYNTIAGSVFTWRQIPDWLDRDALPEWVVSGRSS